MKVDVKCQADKCRTQPVVSAEAQRAKLMWAAGGHEGPGQRRTAGGI